MMIKIQIDYIVAGKFTIVTHTNTIDYMIFYHWRPNNVLSGKFERRSV